MRRPLTTTYSYSVEIMSRDPLVIYIRDFLQPGEAEHMISSAVPAMARSMVASLPTNDTKTMANKMDEQRTSSSAFMTRGQDAVMQCIEQRAADFVGEEREKLEGLQVVWYRIGQKYNPSVPLLLWPLRPLLKPNGADVSSTQFDRFPCSA